uniref:Reelin domain-containing protein n=1 Tax=Esox lucius TaxID=8010 RepID=A0A3P8Y8M7_ESOLU
MVGILCVLLSLTALRVEGYSSGGSLIQSQCASMDPSSVHGTMQNSPPPYTVTVNQTTYKPGDTISGESSRR